MCYQSASLVGKEVGFCRPSCLLVSTLNIYFAKLLAGSLLDLLFSDPFIDDGIVVTCYVVVDDHAVFVKRLMFFVMSTAVVVMVSLVIFVVVDIVVMCMVRMEMVNGTEGVVMVIQAEVITDADMNTAHHETDTDRISGTGRQRRPTVIALGISPTDP
jgi:hypothetical protein